MNQTQRRSVPCNLPSPAFLIVLAGLGLSTALANPLDPRDIRNGWEIPSEGYADQPYVVVRADGAWVCTLTTGPGDEGDARQHVVAAISTDQGKTWSELIDIEPHGPPEASWVMPLIVPSGRIYAFYVYNGDNLREVIASTAYARRRVDTLGHFVFKYSDDGGHTWSAERHRIPIREFEIDRKNPYGGAVQFFWGVGKPHVHQDAVYMGLAKIESFGEGFIEKSEGIFLYSDNILSESDPTQVRWETLPRGEVGIRAPRGPIAEEHNLTSLSDGSLFCTYRTTEGHPCHAYSRDGGQTWTPPAYMTYGPGERRFKHPRAANFVRRFSNGNYLYWFHNHGGVSYQGRNPAWISGGIERDGYIHWSQPEILLYDEDPEVRMSYPDFVEQEGRVFVTETQKHVARTHEIPTVLLDAVWGQMNPADTDAALLFDAAADANKNVRLPILAPGAGFSVEVWAASDASSLMDTRDASGAGLSLARTAEGGLECQAGDGSATLSWTTEPLPAPTGGMDHIVLIFDGGPHLLLFVVNGLLLDGGDVHAQGWVRMPPALTDLNGVQPRLVDPVQKLRVYGRPLRTAEAVARYQAGPDLPGSVP